VAGAARREAALRRRDLIPLGGAVGGALALGARPAAAGRAAPATPAAPAVRDTLPNGLVVLVEERPAADTVGLQLTARSGSREDGDQPGLGALTSRVMFQGTRRRPTETELQRAAAQVGGTLGRGTGVESSFFASRVPWGEAETAFDLLADVVLEPRFEPGALERQQQLALQELARARVEPSALLGDLFQATMFAGHPVATPVLGTPESVGALRREALLAHRERYWSGANLVLTVVGRLPADAALEAAGRAFGPLPPGAAYRRPVAPGRPPEAQVVRGQAGQQQAQVRVGFPAPGLTADDRYPMTVLSALMGGRAGRLQRELRTARGLVYSTGPGYAGFTDAGAWFVAAAVEPRNLEPALDVVRAEVRRLREAPPEPEEVAKRIGQVAGAQALADEGNDARAARLASAEVLGTETLEEFVRRVRQVTPEDVWRVARTYLDPERAVLVVVGP
jgi:predicted Zn-dependent peptidase